MSRIAVAIVTLVGTLIPTAHASVATGSVVTTPIVMQKWHTGVWIAWDRESGINSAQIAVKPYEEFRPNGPLSYRSYFLNDFGYLSLVQRTRNALPYKGDFLISVFALDFKADGKSVPPRCLPFATYPLPRNEKVANDPACLSETIFRVAIDLNLKEVKKIQQEGATFIGVRDVNALGSSSCQIGGSQKSGVCEIADQMLYKTGRAKGGKILYFDSIIHLARVNASVGVQTLFPIKKKGPPEWISLSLLSARDGLWRAEPVVVNREARETSDSYRYAVFDGAKKKYVWFGKTMKVGNILNSQYGIDESLGGLVDPVFSSSSSEK